MSTMQTQQPIAADDPRGARFPSLTDRAVLITGGATGIGEAFVAHFAALVERLADARHAPAFFAADLTDIDALRRAIAELRTHTGAFGVLINNAANDRPHSIEEVTPESFDAAIAVNLRHQFFAAQAVIDDMKSLGGGAIVNLGSISWMLKNGGYPIYATSKAAIQGLTRTLARDLGPFRIRVNALVPGWVMTDKQRALWLDDAGRAAIEAGQCIGDELLPDDLARAALFLAVDDSRMMTAQDVVVDGGWA